MPLSRRSFIKTAAIAGAGAAIGGTAHADLVNIARPTSLLHTGFPRSSRTSSTSWS